jgi:iron-sulfur cluster insertion protein
MQTLVTMTPNAVKKITALLAEENNPELNLRIFVQGGGCSGFQYGFTFDEQVNEDDFTLDIDGARLLVDSMSSQYLQGAEIDYTESLAGSQFAIKNPNAQTSCGCGSSFGV